MITPFVGEKTVVNGKSYGLSAASYDVRIGEDLTLGPNPNYLLAEMGLSWPASQWLVPDWAQKLSNYPECVAKTHTLENFRMPDNVAGFVVDKSTYARMYISAFNTLMDPGFAGNLTLELVNLSSKVVEFKKGDAICQICFQWLDEPTERPYRGKYYGQTMAAHGPRYENSDGSWNAD